MGKNDKRALIQNDPNGNIIQKLWEPLQLTYVSCRRTTAPKNVTVLYRLNFVVHANLKLKSDLLSREIRIYDADYIYVIIRQGKPEFFNAPFELENVIKKVVS